MKGGDKGICITLEFRSCLRICSSSFFQGKLTVELLVIEIDSINQRITSFILALLGSSIKFCMWLLWRSFNKH